MSSKFLHEVAHDPHAGTNYQDLWTQVGRYTYSNFAMQAFGFSSMSPITSAHPLFTDL